MTDQSTYGTVTNGWIETDLLRMRQVWWHGEIQVVHGNMTTADDNMPIVILTKLLLNVGYVVESVKTYRGKHVRTE